MRTLFFTSNWKTTPSASHTDRIFFLKSSNRKQPNREKAKKILGHQNRLLIKKTYLPPVINAHHEIKPNKLQKLWEKNEFCRGFKTIQN